MTFTTEKYMDFINPTSSSPEGRCSIQGMAIYGDQLFQLFHTGVCAVYDLESRKPEPLGVFKLGSYQGNQPDARYANHANQAMFSGEFYEEGDPFPLMYVTIGNSGDEDEDGFIGRCAVERILLKDGQYSAECVQVISFRNDGQYAPPLEVPCWGWPASFVDSENGFFYLFSARYRTTKAFIDKFDRNAYIITKFKLPDVHIGEKVILHPEDILDQFTDPYQDFFTQGGTLRNSRIYYLFGAGTGDYPDALRVYDLNSKKLSARLSFTEESFADEEVECCAFMGDTLLLNTQASAIYQLNISL